MSAIEKIVREWQREFCRCDEGNLPCDLCYIPHPTAPPPPFYTRTATDILIARLKALDKGE